MDVDKIGRSCELFATRAAIIGADLVDEGRSL